MNKNNQTNGQYLAPQVKVVEMQARVQILAGSEGNLGETNRHDGFSWDE